MGAVSVTKQSKTIQQKIMHLEEPQQSLSLSGHKQRRGSISTVLTAESSCGDLSIQSEESFTEEKHDVIETDINGAPSQSISRKVSLMQPRSLPKTPSADKAPIMPQRRQSNEQEQARMRITFKVLPVDCSEPDLFKIERKPLTGGEGSMRRIKAGAELPWVKHVLTSLETGVVSTSATPAPPGLCLKANEMRLLVFQDAMLQQRLHKKNKMKLHDQNDLNYSTQMRRSVSRRPRRKSPAGRVIRSSSLQSIPEEQQAGNDDTAH